MKTVDISPLVLTENKARRVWNFVTDNVARIRNVLSKRNQPVDDILILDVPRPNQDEIWEDVVFLVQQYTKSSSPAASMKIEKALLKKLNGNKTARDFLISDRGQRELAKLLSD